VAECARFSWLYWLYTVCWVLAVLAVLVVLAVLGGNNHHNLDNYRAWTMQLGRNIRGLLSPFAC
jgi:hypothetical protein